MAGLARRLEGCQCHGGRAGQGELEGMVAVAILWRSWGPVPIRDLKNLMTKEKLSSGPSQAGDMAVTPM